jgi:glucose/arabinose dehydrogenase
VLQLSDGADAATVGTNSVKLLNPAGDQLTGSYNTDAVGKVISFTPAARLAALTTYRIRTTTALKDTSGRSFAAYSASFTTGDSGIPPTGLPFTRAAVGSLNAPTAVTVGPDGRLYVATAWGLIRRYTLGSNGLPVGTPKDFTRYAGQRTIIGLRFAPSSTATDLRLWVSHNQLCESGCANFTGAVTILSGPDLGVARNVIVGLPRSIRDHMTNGLDFGPDRRLYIAQGSLNGYGAYDNSWRRDEVPMSAAILVADVSRDPRLFGPAPVNVNTDEGYDPFAADAPVKVYATGTRNPYDLVWHTNGSLYVPVNESASGNAPAGPHDDPPALTDLPPGRDFLARVRQGRYYGHPNPSRGQYVLNGGNPTSGVDPFETPQYPVGVLSDPRWDRPVLNLGLNRSADGIAEYTANAFGGALNGKLLTAEFSTGDDILTISLNDSGNVASVTQLAAGFVNPLDVTVDRRNGNVYVAEFGNQPDGAGGRITLLRPS